MATSPLPNNGHDEEVDGQSDESQSIYDDGSTAWILRLTPYGKYTKEDVIQWLKDSLFTPWVIGVETKPREHFHVVLRSWDEDIKPKVREFLYRYWPAEQRGRGFGNKQYNCTFSTDEDQAVSYAIKEGDYQYDGYSDEYINTRYELSHSPNSTRTFNTEYRELCDRFQNSNMGVNEFMVAFVQLKSKYGQMVNLSHAYSYALSNLFRREPEAAANYVEEFLYRH